MFQRRANDCLHTLHSWIRFIRKVFRFIDTSEKQDADSLYCHILKYFKHCNLNKAQIVAQSYDGANVMAVKFNGIQAKIKNTFPYAIFTHCMAHRMNLVIMDMCKHLKVNMSTE